MDSTIEREYPLLQKYPVEDMARKGLIRLPLEPNGRDAYPLLQSVTPSGLAARLLDEERKTDADRALGFALLP